MGDLTFEHIDKGQAFDFGRTSKAYAKFRDIYPGSLYRKLKIFGAVAPGLDVLDIGTGSGVLPRSLSDSGARFSGLDIAPEQIREAERLSSGMGIRYVVAPAEKTPFEDASFDMVIACQCFWYLSIARFVAELRRILRPRGRFCKIFMAWLPFESKIAYETEQLVLRYNPAWSGSGFQPKPYRMPEWTEELFELETVHIYREELLFSEDSWCGRMRSCRGIGASLPPESVAAFDADLRKIVRRFGMADVVIPHLIQIEIYRLLR